MQMQFLQPSYSYRTIFDPKDKNNKIVNLEK